MIYHAQEPSTIHEMLRFAVSGSNTQYVNISAEAQYPIVVTNTPTVDLSNRLFYNIESFEYLSFSNLSLLDTEFSCKNAIPAVSMTDPKYASLEALSQYVAITPSSGTIKASESLKLLVRVHVPSSDKTNNDSLNHFIPFYYKGRREPLVVHIFGEVSSLKVSYCSAEDLSKSTESVQHQLELDFKTVTIREIVKQTFYIRNDSPIPATYTFRIAGYPSQHQLPTTQRLPERTEDIRSSALSLKNTLGNNKSLASARAHGNLVSAASSHMLGSTTSKAGAYEPPRSAAGPTRSHKLAEVKEVCFYGNIIICRYFVF